MYRSNESLMDRLHRENEELREQNAQLIHGRERPWGLMCTAGLIWLVTIGGAYLAAGEIVKLAQQAHVPPPTVINTCGDPNWKPVR